LEWFHRASEKNDSGTGSQNKRATTMLETSPDFKHFMGFLNLTFPETLRFQIVQGFLNWWVTNSESLGFEIR
jgi:hypothetical protein